MGYQIYRINNNRWGGYGVPSLCEHPSCSAEIDRGVSYACGGEPFSEWGCDLYFCGKHLHYACTEQLSAQANDEEHECTMECEHVEVCERCRDGKESFDMKPETEQWIKHILTDESWAEFRASEPKRVEEMKRQLDNKELIKLTSPIWDE